MNYGYTILHGELARLLVVHGFNTYLGIWHNSNKNAFNLASDFIEVFRPVVDYYCFWNADNLDLPLTLENRKSLINLLSDIISIDGNKCKVSYAMELMVESFYKALKTRKFEYVLIPEILESLSGYEE